ncbi:MAG TPA: hypothetical protein VGX96_06030 [Candidatus Elarobacter sp.]|jgi:hypothetical protein|nr:hypothetical protein [Candidatus Elarobacter sp.]
MFPIAGTLTYQPVREEVRSALASLSFAVALVVDGAGEADAKLQRSGRYATVALGDALTVAAGRPSHDLWREARTLLADFVRDAEDAPLAYEAQGALAALRSFVDENADLA